MISGERVTSLEYFKYGYFGDESLGRLFIKGL